MSFTWEKRKLRSGDRHIASLALPAELEPDERAALIALADICVRTSIEPNADSGVEQKEPPTATGVTRHYYANLSHGPDPDERHRQIVRDLSNVWSMAPGSLQAANLAGELADNLTIHPVQDHPNAPTEAV